jgi:hypothetical protein
MGCTAKRWVARPSRVRRLLRCTHVGKEAHLADAALLVEEHMRHMDRVELLVAFLRRQRPRVLQHTLRILGHLRHLRHVQYAQTNGASTRRVPAKKRGEHSTSVR